MDDLSSQVQNSEYRAALGSIHYNASNFQVFTVSIAGAFLVGMAVLAGTFVAIQNDDQNMLPATLMTIVIIDGVVLGILFFAYMGYLRNIGRYIFGRVKPSFDSEENLKKCPKFVSTGTTPSNGPRS